MANSEEKQKLMQEFRIFVDDCEHYGDVITSEQLHRINQSPRLVQRIADVIRNPKKMFAVQLEELARCMLLLADKEVYLDYLAVCITEDERWLSQLAAKIHELNNWRDMG